MNVYFLDTLDVGNSVLWVFVFLLIGVCIVSQWRSCRYVGIDWVNHMVLNGGCCNLGNELLPDIMSTMEVVLLGSVSEYAVKKLIVKCVFDMVNMKNPSGGMIFLVIVNGCTTFCYF